MTPELALDHAEALGALNRVTAERDAARAVAVRLEQENAELRARLESISALACPDEP